MFNDNICNNLVDHTGLASPWPDWPKAKPTTPKTLYFVDVDGVTLATGPRDAMAAIARRLGGQLRQETITEASNTRESVIRRDRKRVGDYTL